MSNSHAVRRPVSTLDELPPVWPDALLESIAAHRRELNRCLVVLDDDAMAGQSLHGVPVLTSVRLADIAEEIACNDVVVILTDTRSMAKNDALRRMRQVGANLVKASKKANREIDIAMRGDSTLRGHFPSDLDALLEPMLKAGGPRPVCVFVPYFGEAGRVTVDDTHFAVEGDTLVPVHETEFARDPVFRYVDSHLPSWLIARGGKRLTPNQVISVGIEELRTGGPDPVAVKIGSVVDGRFVIANAAHDRDIEVLGRAIATAEASGRRFITCSAAPFVRVRGGMAARDLLTARELPGDAPVVGGGLTIVGSYVERTREQLAYALAQPGVAAVEMDVEDAIYNAKVTVRDRASDVDAALAEGKDAILYLGPSKPPRRASKALEDGRRLSEAFSKIVARLRTRPRYILVKGGNTASHLAVHGLGIRRAMILGQLMGGVPVWQTGAESKWPDMPFVIFAGNVGHAESLTEAIEKLSAKTGGQ